MSNKKRHKDSSNSFLDIEQRGEEQQRKQARAQLHTLSYGIAVAIEFALFVFILLYQQITGRPMFTNTLDILAMVIVVIFMLLTLGLRYYSLKLKSRGKLK